MSLGGHSAAAALAALELRPRLPEPACSAACPASLSKSGRLDQAFASRTSCMRLSAGGCWQRRRRRQAAAPRYHENRAASCKWPGACPARPCRRLAPNQSCPGTAWRCMGHCRRGSSRGRRGSTCAVLWSCCSKRHICRDAGLRRRAVLQAASSRQPRASPCGTPALPAALTQRAHQLQDH